MQEKPKKLPLYKRVIVEQMGNINRYRGSIRRLIAARENGDAEKEAKAQEEYEYHRGILHNALESQFYFKGNSTAYILSQQDYSRMNYWRMVEEDLLGGDVKTPTA
jgi:hypothetical protein